jgi:hypothetical protein
MAKKYPTQSAYSLKLKDPKWQKKRLEVLERDKWTCQKCDDKESTLHVHHIKYSTGNPWEIDNKFLITLCEECHSCESNDMPSICADLISSLKNKGCMSEDVFDLLEIVFYLDFKNKDLINGLSCMLRSKEDCEKISNWYRSIIDENKPKNTQNGKR